MEKRLDSIWIGDTKLRVNIPKYDSDKKQIQATKGKSEAFILNGRKRGAESYADIFLKVPS